MLALVLAAAAPLFEQVNLFEAGTGGYAHYRVPAIAVSKAGTVLAFTEARKSTSGDWGMQDILLRRSTDGGKNWNAPRRIANVEGEIPPNPVALAQNLDKPGDTTYNNVVPVVDRSGEIHVLFCAEYAQCFVIHSRDDAKTFSKPAEITAAFLEFRTDYAWRVIATGPGHGIQLRNGRIVVPVWLSDGTAGHAHRPSIVSVIYSDDHARTWKRGGIVVRHPELKNPSETVAVELADGRVMLNIRSESLEHRRAVSYSKDGATGWTKPVFDSQLVEPVCMGSILRLGKSILFVNPQSTEPRDTANPAGNFKRQNVSVKLSDDEGKTWPVSRVLEPGPSGYSDLAAGKDRTIYCIYERGALAGRETHIRYLTVARFNLAWVRAR